ncbi:MAG: hypothetical protein RL322_841 [Pseudomonadota bacterium]
MIAFRILLGLTALALLGCLAAFLMTRDRRHLRRAVGLSVVAAALALVFFAGLFLARL